MIEITGKNGAGKSYLANELYRLGYKRNIGYTTREIRAGEVDGIDYFFVSKPQFEELIRNHELVDYKMRNNQYYGISKKNIYPNTIFVSGDSSKIIEATGYSLLKLYIDCDLLTRYERVLRRKDLLINTFNRFHSENFSYLIDFNGVFINNDLEDNALLSTTIEDVIEGDYTKYLTSNIEFLSKKVSEFDFTKLSEIDNKLLIMLYFEEYLLRKIFLEKKILQDDIIETEYYNQMLNFASSNDIGSQINENGLNVKIDDQIFNFDYKMKRKCYNENIIYF